MTDLPKISCCMIVRDEAATLRACLESIRPHVDELVIVDTGSSDGTPAIAREFADKFEIYLECNDPHTGLINDFSQARNRSFELASHEWVFWCDGDDVVTGAEKLRALAASVKEDTVTILMPYEYSFEDGVCTNLHYRERLMRPRSAFRWISPVHEGCLINGEVEGTQRIGHSDEIRIIHKRPDDKPQEPGEPGNPEKLGRNLRILKQHILKHGESDVRALFYYGLELGYHGDIGASMSMLRRYVQLSGWSDEKCLAQLKLAECYRVIGDHQEAINWALQAMATKSWDEPYWALVRSFYALAMAGGRDEIYNLNRALHFGQLGMILTQNNSGQPQTVLFNNPRAKFEIQDFLNVCYSRVGHNDEAIASCEAGLSGLPNHERMRKNLAKYKQKRAREQASSCADMLEADGSITTAARDMIRDVLSGTTKIMVLQANPEAEENASPARSYREPLAEGKLDIVFFLGEALERWNPERWTKTGMGGSETMAWHMARGLAALGHRVRVFAHCLPTQQGVFEGVEWFDSALFRGVRCDVLIASRRPDAVDDAYGCKATVRILWVHDIHCGAALDMKRSLRFDRIFVLSEWHKQHMIECYPPIPPAKYHVTRNGIDLNRFDFEADIIKNPHRAIYSSSPDRGLQTALECWPKIRAEIPDAELHVFYGWLNWERMAQLSGDEPALRSIEFLRRLARSTEGVVLRDRVNQNELAREFGRAAVWAYPTWFSETSCITAMEAQAAGCIMVTSPIAALVETAGKRAVMIDGDWRDPEYMRHWTEAVITAMHYAETSKLGSEINRKYAAENFGIDSLIGEWDLMLTELVSATRASVVPQFNEAFAAQ